MANKLKIKDALYPIVKTYYLKSTFLDPAFYDMLARSSSLKELVSRLRSSARYTKCLEEGIADAKSLETALIRCLAEIHYYLMHYYPKEAVIKALFDRYVSWDVKIVLKGKATGMEYETILRHINMRAEELIGRRDLIVKAASADSLPEAVDALAGTEYENPSRMGYKLYQQTGDPAVFDFTIDKYLVEKLVSSVFSLKKRRIPSKKAFFDPYTRELVMSFVDEYNVSVVLRYQDLGLTRSQARELLFSKSLFLNMEELEKIIDQGLGAQEIANVLKKTPYSKTLIGITKDKIIASIRLFRLKKAAKAWRLAPMSHPDLLAAIILIENEVRNIAAIAFGIENSLPRESLVNSIVLP